MKDSVRAKASAMKEINALSLQDAIVIFGSDYMAGFPLYEFVNRCELECAVYNRSIADMTIAEALELVDDCVIALHPKKVFIAFGDREELDSVFCERYTALVSHIRARLPDCKVYLIDLVGEGAETVNFRRCLCALCDGKQVQRISFAMKSVSQAALYKARFKQMSCHFRDRMMTSSEAFAIAKI